MMPTWMGCIAVLSGWTAVVVSVFLIKRAVERRRNRKAEKNIRNPRLLPLWAAKWTLGPTFAGVILASAVSRRWSITAYALLLISFGWFFLKRWSQNGRGRHFGKLVLFLGTIAIVVFLVAEVHPEVVLPTTVTIGAFYLCLCTLTFNSLLRLFRPN
jgi:hypothetical protein